MAQQTSGWKTVLSVPKIYDFVQAMVGANKQRRLLVGQHFKLFSGARVLDVGCGTGELYQYLPQDIQYTGVDLSAAYVAQAQANFGSRAKFICADLSDCDLAALGTFDRVIGTGILHHLDDQPAHRLLEAAAKVLAPGGHLITVDPALVDGQPRLARAVILRDRGRNVRSPREYAALAEPYFSVVNPIIRADLLYIPYTHCILSCAK